MGMSRKKQHHSSKVNADAQKKPFENINGIFLTRKRFLRVIDQPKGRPGFISGESGIATKFRMASEHGNIGLIAHNYLEGKHFLNLKVGDKLYVTNENEEEQCYRIKKIHRFQALDPRSPRSDFLNLKTRNKLKFDELFNQIYTGDHRLVLQTCIEKDEDQEWGRFFAIAHLV